MAQIFDSSTGETIVRSDLRVPADAQGNPLNATIVRVENFLTADERPDAIDFVLDERLRERTLKTLLDRSVIGSVGIAQRDLANSIIVDRASVTPVYITALMKSRLYDPQAVRKVIDIEFKELV
jgi:hypothetical protein